MEATEYLVDVTERDLDFLFAEEIECSPEFRSWLIGQTGEQATDVDVHRIGRSIATRYGETDLLLVYGRRDGTKRALMIENKVAAPFTPLQAERYRIRGQEGITAGEWKDFTTVLLAPRKRLSEVSSGSFDFFIAYEDCEAALVGTDHRVAFKRRIIRTACAKSRTPWIGSIDPIVTEWFLGARTYSATEFPDLPLPAEGTGRAPANTWLNFYLKEFPGSRVGIEIKPMNGVVDLRFLGVGIGDLRRELGSFLPERAETEQAQSGKSVSVRTKHTPADLNKPFPGQEEVIRPMLASADELRRFALERVPQIMRLLGYAA